MRTVLELIMSHKWAITPDALEALIAVVERHADASPEALAQLSLKEVELSNIFHPGADPKEAVEKIRGQALSETNFRVRLRDNVAIIPVMGPIFPRANLFTAFSGATSIQTLARDFSAAVEDPRVKSIILDIDSPGGAITGVSEFADMIFKAQGEKRILTYVEGIAASAAYWIGSSAMEVLAADTAELGSIGVVAGFVSTRERDEKSGVKRIEIVSSQSPNKRLSPETDEGRKAIQTIVDELAGIFISKVATHRGVDIDTVHNQFGQGGLFVAATAITHEMADGVSSLEELIEEENKPHTRSTLMGGISMGAGDKTEVTYTVEAVRESSPDTFAAIKKVGHDEGVQVGIQQERDRVQAIEGLKVPGYEAFIVEHKYDEGMTRDKMSSMVLEEQNRRTEAAGRDVGKDAKDLETASESIDTRGGDETEPEKDAKARQDTGARVAKHAEKYQR